VGLFISIDLIFNGWCHVIVAIAAKKQAAGLNSSDAIRASV